MSEPEYDINRLLRCSAPASVEIPSLPMFIRYAKNGYVNAAFLRRIHIRLAGDPDFDEYDDGEGVTVEMDHEGEARTLFMPFADLDPYTRKAIIDDIQAAMAFLTHPVVKITYPEKKGD